MGATKVSWVKKESLVWSLKHFLNILSSQDKRLNQSLLELQHLKSKLLEVEQETKSLRERAEAEKSLNRDLLTERTKLRSDLQAVSEDKEKHLGQVGGQLIFFLKPIFYRIGQRLWYSSRAHSCGAKLLRSWVRNPPGAGLFSYLNKCVHNFRSLI